MLTEQKFQSLKQLIEASTTDEIIWMSGYLAGLSNQKATADPPVVQHKESDREKLLITVLYGTESGNSKKISMKLAAALKTQQHKTTVTSLDQYNVANLEKERLVFFVISTQGDGEPPVSAQKFYDQLFAKQHDLSNVSYAVLALGDSSYPLFCKAGEDVDARIKELGAKQLLPLEKLDIDFNLYTDEWVKKALQFLPSSHKKTSSEVASKQVLKKGKHFYNGIISRHINLNDKGSFKETWHIEIESNEAIDYLPGDSLGIIPNNTDEEVNEIMRLLPAQDSKLIAYKSEHFSLFDLLKHRLGILHLPQRIIKKYSDLINTELPAVRMDLKNVVSLYPLTSNVSVNDLIAILEPITPRLYSISSSPSAHGNNNVHITVSRNKFSVNEKMKYGFCSSHFAMLNKGDEVTFYVHPNNNFRLPQHDKDVIMIGPGSGIAPFRSFLFERDSEGATGRNWLFFGDQHFATDFLYQSELLSLFDTGALTKINTAFSRDQKEKMYVQHRMQQQAKELFAWLENGAHLYICGSKEPMAKDVENTLIEIITQQKNTDKQSAAEYVNKLEAEGRFLKDVY